MHERLGDRYGHAPCRARIRRPCAPHDDQSGPRRPLDQDATPGAGPASIATEFDVVYGEVNGEELLLDVWHPPARETPRPAVMLFHGGPWMQGIGRRTDMNETARALAAAGYVAVNVEYRVMDDVPGHNLWPALLDDAQRAVRWVRANAATLGIDPDRIGSSGGSSGGIWPRSSVCGRPATTATRPWPPIRVASPVSRAYPA